MPQRQESSIPVYVGDTVMVVFWHRPKAEPREARILEVKKRYGYVSNGQYRQQPLVRAHFPDVNEEKTFDAGLVVSIFSRTSVYQPPINIYAQDPLLGQSKAMVMRYGSVWEGDLLYLAGLALSKLPFAIEREIDFEKLEKLYSRQRVGLISHDDRHNDLIWTVNRYRFCAWIRRNWSRILYTTSELNREYTVQNRGIEDDYWADDHYWKDQQDQFWDEVRDEEFSDFAAFEANQD